MDRQSERSQAAVQRSAVIRQAVIKKAAVRSTKASAKLEDRQVPAGHVRSAGVKRLLAERQGRKR